MPDTTTPREALAMLLYTYRTADILTGAPWRELSPEAQGPFLAAADAFLEGLGWRENSVTLNSVGWRLAEALGQVDPGAERIEVDVLELVDSMVAKLAEVRELHKPVDIEPSETICGECSHALSDGTYEPMVDWPCPTIALLDGEATS